MSLLIKERTNTWKADLFDDIVIKVSSRINKWYNIFLSHAGRALLIRIVTNIIPTYVMATSQHACVLHC